MVGLFVGLVALRDAAFGHGNLIDVEDGTCRR